MIILGLNAYHGDSSACIVVDGQLLAAKSFHPGGGGVSRYFDNMIMALLKKS